MTKACLRRIPKREADGNTRTVDKIRFADRDSMPWLVTPTGTLEKLSRRGFVNESAVVLLYAVDRVVGHIAWRFGL